MIRSWSCLAAFALLTTSACKKAESNAPPPAAAALAGDTAGAVVRDPAAPAKIAVPGAVPSTAGGATTGGAMAGAAAGAPSIPAANPPGAGASGTPGAPSVPSAPAAGDDGAVAADAPSTPDASFKLQVTPPAAATAGQEAVARVKVVPSPGWKMNKEYPTKLVIQPVDGVTIAKPQQVLTDAATFNDHELAFDVRVTPAKAGTYKVSGMFKFAVCTDVTCDPKKQAIAFNVTAK